MRLILAEDDPMIGQSIHDGLQLDGFVVDWVQDGEQAKQALSMRRPSTLCCYSTWGCRV